MTGRWLVLKLPRRKVSRLTTSGSRLKIDGLTIIYDGEFSAVGGIDLDIEPGEFVTLLGPSGSGKTSILMAIAGFVKPAAGEILVGDQDLLHLPPNERNLGLVFQDYALFPHMTVAQNIGFPLKMRDWRSADIDAAVDEVLRMVRLTGYGSRRPTQLSGGEQQRVALARATVFDPPVLLMDEPLGALDRQLREQLQDELKSIQHRTGITTLYVTHDQEEAMMLSDRIAVMRDGTIEQIGTPAELYEHPSSRFVAEFVGESNIISGVLSGSSGSMMVETGSGWQLPLISPDGLAPGDAVELAIRPERLTIGETQRQVTMQAEIVEVTYRGDMIRVVVEPAPGERLAVKQQNRGQAGHYRPGDRISLGWDQSDMAIIRG